jgi:methyltransferase (TIGR00027 family)
MAEALTAAGYRPGEPTAFVVEGLTIYLPEDKAADLLGTLARLGGPGSRLAVTFESGFERQRFMRRFAAAYYGRAGEPLRFRLGANDAERFLSEAGWTIDRLLTGSQLESEYLSRTTMAGVTLNTSSFMVEAGR